MATSSALSTDNKYIKYQITVTEGTPDVAGNTSPVTVSVRFYRTNTGYKTWGSGTVYCKINGTTYSAAVTSSQYITNSGIVLFTKTLDIAHDDDGSKVLPVTAWISHSQVTSSEQGFNVTLTTIARASQPSCVTWPNHTQNVGNFGDTISIHMNRKSANFKHTVRYAYGNLTGTIANNVETGTTWTIPLSFMELIPNATSGSGTIYVDTYNGSTLIGTKYCGFTATVPASVKPTCSIQVLDATKAKLWFEDLVQGMSKLSVKVTAAGAYKSTIKSYSVTANNTTYTSAEITTEALTDSGTTTVRATVTDSRGRTSNAATASFPVLPYTEPAITALSVHRCDEDGTENDQGEFVQVTFSASVTDLNGYNIPQYKLKYKKTSEDTYTAVELTNLEGERTVEDYSYILEADSDYSYDIEVEVRDSVPGTKRTRSTSASTGFTFMDWNDDGKSLAFGKVSEESGALENALNLVQLGNTYTFSSIGAETTDGFIRMAQINITATNADTPITFELSRRKAIMPMRVHVLFKATDNLDPELESIVYEGANYGAFLVKTATSTWQLFVQKANQSDTVTLNRWSTSYRQMKRIKLSFPDGIVSQVPTPYHRATPAKMQSLLDFIYPVGSIYLSYSHVSPENLFGGTWERIENAFLWATTENGTIGQTGGESEHTLTVAEIPSHSHQAGIDSDKGINGSVVTSGATTAIAYFANNTGRSTANAGGGAAHNNMPPYIQVSVWRRTA